jgi:hypothetical protein
VNSHDRSIRRDQLRRVAISALIGRSGGGSCGSGSTGRTFMEVSVFRMTRRPAMIAAGVSLLLLCGVGSGAAQAAQGLPSGQLEEFDFTVTHSPPQFLGVIYSTGVDGTAGGTIDFQSGATQEINFLDNAWTLIPRGPGTVNATVTDWRLVDGPTITGTAHVPAGASMTVTVGDTQQTVPLTNGKFSISTGVGQFGAPPPKRGTRVVRCRGGARSCRATVSLAGGARNRRIVIRLSDTDFLLKSVKAPPRRAHAAYGLTGGHFAEGGSEYVVTLNAARSSPPKSHLTLIFGRSA